MTEVASCKQLERLQAKCDNLTATLDYAKELLVGKGGTLIIPPGELEKRIGVKLHCLPQSNGSHHVARAAQITGVPKEPKNLLCQSPSDFGPRASKFMMAYVMGICRYFGWSEPNPRVFYPDNKARQFLDDFKPIHVKHVADNGQEKYNAKIRQEVYRELNELRY